MSRADISHVWHDLPNTSQVLCLNLSENTIGRIRICVRCPYTPSHYDSARSSPAARTLPTLILPRSRNISYSAKLSHDRPQKVHRAGQQLPCYPGPYPASFLGSIQSSDFLRIDDPPYVLPTPAPTVRAELERSSARIDQYSASIFLVLQIMRIASS